MAAKTILATVLPSVAAAATAVSLWLLRSNGGDDDSDAAAAASSSGSLQLVLPTGSLATRSPDELSVVTYNGLADCFSSKLEYCEPALLDWATHRWPLLQAQLATWGADVVMLQEVDVVWLPQWLEFAASVGYAAVHQDTKGKQVVCMTLYKAPKLELWWADTGRSRSLPAAFVFTDSSGSLQVLYTANLHLEGSPYKPAERVSQLRSALASLTKHQASAGLPPGECHVVVAGDLNSSAAEGACRLLREGWLPAGYREAHLPGQVVVPAAAPAAGGGSAQHGGDVTQPYLLADAYAAHPLPFTRKVPQLASHLDHLFVTPASMAIVALLWPLDEALPADRRLAHSRHGLPNATHPSDHLPLGVKLRVVPADAARQS